MKFLGIVVLLVLVSGCGKKAVSFREEIQPILNDRCGKCHIGEHASGGVVLNSFESVMNSRTKKGKYPIVVAGKLSESWLYILSRTDQPHFQMPPDSSRSGKLPEKEVELLGKWIVQGAHDN